MLITVNLNSYSRLQFIKKEKMSTAGDESKEIFEDAKAPKIVSSVINLNALAGV